MLTPPTYAKREAGEVKSAKLLPFKLQHPKTKHTYAQRAGLLFERKAFLHLEKELGAVLFHPAFRFNSGKRFDEHAIPDALYIHDNILTIFEIKLSHTADAWYQLKLLYLPIVSKVYPDFHINLVEICKSYDPSIRLAETPEIIDSLHHFCCTPKPTFGVYIWRGR